MQESFDAERELEAKLNSDEDMIPFQVHYYIAIMFYLLQTNYENELAEVTGEEKCDTSGKINFFKKVEKQFFKKFSSNGNITSMKIF